MPRPPLDPSAALEARIQALEARVAALEGVRPEREARAEQPPAEPGTPVALVLGLAGRTCLILGGAFLIRAFTDSGTLPAAAGIALGLAFAAFWALGAHRSAARGARPWASFQILAAALIAYPLLWETTVRFRTLAPGPSASVLLLATLLLLAVAIRHGLRGPAWITLLGALGTGFALMAATSAITRFAAFFILLSGAGLALAGQEAWRGLRWLGALGADLAVLVLILLALAPGGSAELARDLRPAPVLALALGFAALHLAGILVRILRQPRVVGAFEVFQTVAVLTVGFGGALRVAPATGPLGAAALLAGLGCYACAFVFVARQAEGSLDFKYLTSLALILVLAGGLLVLDRQALALVCLATGMATTFLGVRHARMSLQLHGAFYLGAAAAASGLLETSLRAWLVFGGHPSPWPLAACLTLAALGAGHLLLQGRPGVSRLPSFTFGTLGLLGLGGLLASASGAALGASGLLAALRTALLVALAAGAAAMGRWKPASELPWLAYPLLGCAALKLLLEDLPLGRPPTLFLAFTLFGAGLLAVPKLLGKRG